MGRLTELFDYLNNEESNISNTRCSHLTIDPELRRLKKKYKKNKKRSKKVPCSDGSYDNES